MEHANIKSPLIKADPKPTEKTEQIYAIPTQIPGKAVKTAPSDDTSKQAPEKPQTGKIRKSGSSQVPIVDVGNEAMARPKRADSISIMDHSLRSDPTVNMGIPHPTLETPKPSLKQFSDYQELQEVNNIKNSIAIAANQAVVLREKPAQVDPPVLQQPKFLILGYRELHAVVFYQQRISRWTHHSIEQDDKYFKNHQINHVDASMVLSSYSREI
jgi:hypothetical protein